MKPTVVKDLLLATQLSLFPLLKEMLYQSTVWVSRTPVSHLGGHRRKGKNRFCFYILFSADCWKHRLLPTSAA